eukprot:226478-Chlamydomonas_euryale.AAC.3
MHASYGEASSSSPCHARRGERPYPPGKRRIGFVECSHAVWHLQAATWTCGLGNWRAGGRGRS